MRSGVLFVFQDADQDADQCVRLTWIWPLETKPGIQRCNSQILQCFFRFSGALKKTL